MIGRRATLDEGIVGGFERALLDMSCVFILIEGNAVSMINLNYSTYLKSFT